jgi:hypothetical protein
MALGVPIGIEPYLWLHSTAKAMRQCYIIDWQIAIISNQNKSHLGNLRLLTSVNSRQFRNPEKNEPQLGKTQNSKLETHLSRVPTFRPEEHGCHDLTLFSLQMSQLSWKHHNICGQSHICRIVTSGNSEKHKVKSWHQWSSGQKVGVLEWA